MDDIARIANVSKPTVSRVLNNSPLVNAETRDRVLAAARDQGYAVNRNAQKLRNSHANAVAVVLDFASYRRGAIGDPFIFELLAGISEALSVRNIDLLLSPPGLDSAAAFIDLHRSRSADGFIVLGQGARDALLRDVARRKVPMVVWGAVREDAGYCTVGSDNYRGGRLAGERFLKLGRKRWLFVGNTRHEEIRLRLEGLRAAAADASSVQIETLEVESMALSAVRDSAAAYLKSSARPDAVFAFSDTAAMAILGVFAEHNYRSPEHFSLVGYNNIPAAAHFTPAISTVEQQTDVAGAIMVEKLMQMIEGALPRSAMLATRLVERQT